MRKLSVFVFIFAAIQLTTARAAEVVRIMTGGPSTAKKFAPLETSIEKASGAQIEVTVNPIDAGMVALSNGVIDGLVGPLDASFSAGEKRAKTTINRSEYQWTEISRSQINIGVHPSNPVKSLTKEQITDILSGKTKTWESITGQKTPVTVLLAKNYVAATNAIAQHYLNADSVSTAQMVMNKDGLIGGIKSNPGAIAFFTSKETTPGFSPKFLATDVSMVNVMIMKKPAKPDAQKVFDYFKANPKALQD